VANHVCWMDILISIAFFFPSFVSKKSIKNFPGVGPIAQAIDCVFLDRAGTKEEKIAAGLAIEKRQKENEDGSRAPILIFPEGATTNNKSVIQFKRGPFSGLNSVQPMGLKYWSVNGISYQNDTIG
jgi:1-acyl-sn-glycerol-3-phosphate acyltransferase